ncbi:MAG: nucleotidyl transferase AbiEii/AbiGii toxin family protein [Chitinispirillales bacterium]|jgi:predicted nucleotidyltransferase component of viral defense system|nr:nucleotidyl transferase AbiEii/AbiGii toxin family protein [Chitinispirillales bacterium]
MNKFTNLQDVERIKYIDNLTLEYNLSTVAIEKDWWISTVLRALFALPYAENLSFKGGTSLSKCYNLIERFSEDIDIAVYREFLGFDGTLSKTQINDKLRRAACSFVREKLQFDIAKELENQGINADLFSVNVNITPITTTDPEIIEVHYKSLFPESNYIKPIVKLEISGRSMNEPLQKIALQSFIDETYSDKVFAETPFEVNAVVPERTFLEKICLLHEEFAKPQKFMRTERMSRHLYDLERMYSAGIAEKALLNKELYTNIIEHRRIFIGLKDFDYDTLAPHTIKIIPPDNIITLWKADYETMQETMIYGESLSFSKLIERIKQLNKKINEIEW